MTGPRPGAVGSVIDAYRADAAEREASLRTIEKRNRVLEAESAQLHRDLLFLRESDALTFSLGALAGACLFGVAAAIDRGDRDAMVVWGSLALLFTGVRLILCLRGKRP